MNMKNIVLSIMLLLASVPASAAGCIGLYYKASLQHDKLVSEKPGSGQYYDELAQLEDRMFRNMDTCKDNARLFSLMAEIQVTANQVPLARLYAQKALDTDPAVWQSQHAMGNVLTLEKDYENALPYLARASELAPDRIGLKLNLCRTQARAGKYTDAVKTCTMVIKSDEQAMHALAYHFRSMAYTGLQDTVAAKSDNAQAEALGLAF